MVASRRYERVGFLCKLELKAVPEGVPQPARSIDLSLGGVGVVTQAAFAVGDLVAVAFIFKTYDLKPIRDEVVGRTVNLVADTDANLIGIQFLHVLTESEHPELVAKLMCSV